MNKVTTLEQLTLNLKERISELRELILDSEDEEAISEIELEIEVLGSVLFLIGDNSND